MADEAAEGRFETILIESVVPTYDAVMAELSKTVPADQVFAELRARRATRSHRLHRRSRGRNRLAINPTGPRNARGTRWNRSAAIS